MPVELPTTLASFHSVLFPPKASYYHKQFLCYSYLRILEASKQTTLVTSYDSRVTYSLDSLQEYFRLNRVSIPTSSSFEYNLLIFGNYQQLEQNNYYYNNFSIRQVGNTAEVLVYSEVDKVYLKGEKTSPVPSSEMQITLVPSSSEPNKTEIVEIGATGLSFAISGPLERFSNTEAKGWTFVAESPFLFDFPGLVDYLNNNQTMVDKMLGYGKAENTSDVNLWNQHFNDIYRFSGLLNTYVSKVNDLWQKEAM